ncbi:SDR family oxidoreductase [Candidatus Uhrbacteria bacterium]|nr:SDR family oxidoreductase [Candidatus Uhrbacteria bacterium]
MPQKTALIIGGSGGIGSAIVKRLLDEGFYVCATYAHASDRMEALRDELRGKAVAFYPLDLLDGSGVKAAMRLIRVEHPQLDAVVYGPTLPIVHTPLLESAWRDFESHIAVQVQGIWQIVQALQSQFVAGNPTRFVIILTEYCIGKPPRGLAAYITAKYALMGFAKIMSVELSRYRCTVNMISPGMVKTDLLSEVPSKLIELSSQQNPLHRIAEPNDVAAAAAFLCSEDTSYLNGINIVINGGQLMI